MNKSEIDALSGTIPTVEAASSAAEAKRRAAIVRKRRINSIVKPVSGVIIIFLIWYLIVELFDIPRYLLVSPIDALHQFVLRPMYYVGHSAVTLQSGAIGFVLGVVLGMLFGMAIHYMPLLRSTIYPSLIALNTIPKMALAPLFVVWFGFGIESKILVAMLIAFFPIVVATIDGLASVSTELHELARINKASSWQRFRKIDFMFALPQIFTSMKISVTMAVGGAVVGEFIAGRSGLGYIIMIANNMVDLSSMFAAFIALAALSMVLFAIIQGLERILIPWARYRDMV